MKKVMLSMILGVLMMSCGMGGFNKQKYTNLKKRKTTYTTESVEVNQDLAEEYEEVAYADEVIELEDNNPLSIAEANEESFELEQKTETEESEYSNESQLLQIDKRKEREAKRYGKKGMKHDENHAVHKTGDREKARKLFFWALASLAATGFGILLYLVTFSGLAFVGIAIAVSASLFGYIALSISAFKTRRYMRDCKENGIIPDRKARSIRFWTWSGLFFFSAIGYCSPALLVLLITHLVDKRQRKKKKRRV